MISRESIKKDFYALPANQVVEALGTTERGLGDAEAERRSRVFGLNALPEGRRFRRLGIFFNQVKSPLILILLFAAVVTTFLKEYGDAAVILAAVLVNTLLGYYQESKAEEALSRLKTYLIERSIVERGGGTKEIETKDLVPGDVIKLRQGTRVPADARVIFENNAYADEAVLTGESLPEKKSVEPAQYGTPLADRASMVYSGTIIAEGFCHAVVVATGVDTEIGKIALLVSERKRERTPLQESIGTFSRTFGIFVASATAALFVGGLLSGKPVIDMFLITVAVAVASVPEGLPIALTVVLAVGVKRLAEKKGIVRKLLAAETLGSTSVILTDKTGTLTESKMAMEGIIDYGESGTLMLEIATLNSDVIVENPSADPKAWELIGTHPLETAIVRGAAVLGVLKPHVDEVLKPIEFFPFNAERKYSASIITLHQKPVVGFLGAPEVLLAASERLQQPGGKRKELGKDDRDDIFEEIDSLAYHGKRVLGVAVRDLEDGHARGGDVAELAKHLTFLGLITLSDPIRPTAKEAMRNIRSLGVRVVIVTGDHPGTAESVARELGFPLDGEGRIMTGEELEVISNEALGLRLERVVIYARVPPAGKLKILKAFEDRGDIVAMTGDGVNDAPTLKNASIGIALGSGTDVAKDVSDLVLLEDDFSVIVEAIKEGRKIYQNIRKSIVYLLSSSFTELILVGGAIFAGIPFALEAFALQILWINIFSDSFPAVSLAFEHNEEDAARRIKREKRSLLDAEMRAIVFLVGISTDLVLFCAAYLLHRTGMAVSQLQTLMFAALGTNSILYIFSIRDLGKPLLRGNPFRSRILNVAVGFGLCMIAAAVYVPALNEFLHTEPLPLAFWGGIALFSAFSLTLLEIVKFVFSRRKKTI